MSEEELILAAKEIIANGCGCDRFCETDGNISYPCSCANDAIKIFELFANAALEHL